MEMNEVLLYRCSGSIEANVVANILEVNGIAFRTHDETADQRTGAHGPLPGIAIYVAGQDYERAMELIAPAVSQWANDNSHACPKDGSEDIATQYSSKYYTPLILLSILLFLAPCLYIFNTKGWGLTHNIAAALFLLSIVLMFVANRLSKRGK